MGSFKEILSSGPTGELSRESWVVMRDVQVPDFQSPQESNDDWIYIS